MIEKISTTYLGFVSPNSDPPRLCHSRTDTRANNSGQYDTNILSGLMGIAHPLGWPENLSLDTVQITQIITF